LRPELAEIKDAFLSKIQPVTKEGAESRINGVVGALCARPYDVAAAAADFGVSVAGLDVSKTSGFKPLYSTLNRNDPPGMSVRTFALGLKPVAGDPESEGVAPYWLFWDYPETRQRFYVPKGVCDDAMPSDTVTSYAKYHVIIPEKEPPYLFVNPLHFTRPGRPSAIENLESMRSRHLATGDKDAVHDVEYRLQLLREQPMASVFKHRDRNMVLALAAFDVARSLGIRDIRLPGPTIIEMEVKLESKFQRLIDKGITIGDVQFVKRYHELAAFMQQSPQFKVSEWDGTELI